MHRQRHPVQQLHQAQCSSKTPSLRVTGAAIANMVKSILRISTSCIAKIKWMSTHYLKVNVALHSLTRPLFLFPLTCCNPFSKEYIKIDMNKSMGLKEKNLMSVRICIEPDQQNSTRGAETYLPRQMRVPKFKQSFPPFSQASVSNTTSMIQSLINSLIIEYNNIVIISCYR